MRNLIPILIALWASWPSASFARAAETATEPAARSGPNEAAPTAGSISRAEQAVRRDGYTPARMLALGQAQLEQAQLGPAIVSFERGLLLSPRNAALREALTKARVRAGLPSRVEATRFSRFAQDVSVREWSYAAAACGVALAIALLGLTLSKRRRRLGIAGAFMTALALAVTLGGTYAARQRLSTAYVLQEGSVLRQSPFPTATVVAQLRPGEAIEPQRAHADFVYVRSERGENGWIRRPELASLIPSTLVPDDEDVARAINP
jgi:hypothetical protein